MSSEVLGSRPKVKILSILLEMEEINITALVRESGLGYRTVERHIKELQDQGLISEKKFGRIRIIRLRKNDPRISSLKRLFMEWKVGPGIRV